MIGILTFIGTQSHGACWQAFALKTELKELGYETEIIDYIAPGIKQAKENKYPKNNKNWKKKLGAIKRLPVLKQRWKKFDEFEKQYLEINVRKEYLDTEKYDAVIVGSDQVWNLEITGNDYNFFLADLQPGKQKWTYAASLGVDAFPEEAKERCVALLQSFSFLNVREDSLRAYLQPMLPDKQIHTVLDPTLLLSGEKWKSIVPKTPLEKEPYLLVHYPEDTSAVWNQIMQIAKEKNLKILYITNRIKKKKGCQCLYAVSPVEYLQYIYYADMVVTGSFHTLSFSLTFHKNFWCTRSMIAERNSRLSNLLNVAGCEDRLLEQYTGTAPDFIQVDRRVGEARTRSIEILENMCQNTVKGR